MALNEATFALLQPPIFDVLPDTDVRLGTVHPRTKSRPRRPDTKRQLNRASRVPVPQSLYRTRIDPSIIIESKKLRSYGTSITAHLPFLQGIGGDISGEDSNETTFCISATNVETQWFSPDEAYFAQALKSVAVRKELWNIRTPSVFMVTGVKIAERATIVTGRKRTIGSELGPEIDLTPFGIPIELGATINAKRGDHLIILTQKAQFVLAFETRRIKVRKDMYVEGDFNKFALLDDETGKSGLTSKRLEEILSFDGTLTEDDDE
jgi:hypothetical protein